MKSLIFPLILLIPVSVFAQSFSYKKTAIQKESKACTLDPYAILIDWNPAVLSLEMPTPGGQSYRSFLAEIKKHQQKTPGLERPYNRRLTQPAPVTISSFIGNPYNNRIPNDNDMAISNDGMLVSVINSSVYAWDITEDTLIFSYSLAAFSDTLGIPNSKYDPKVQYDPDLDRFVMVFLNGFNDSTSHIILAFSSTNHPGDPWHLYSLDGNPFNDSTWTDYPMIALTKDELFLTGNSILNDTTWQAGFTQTLIWQMDKHKAFAGDTLEFVIYSQTEYQGKRIRNMRPVQGGSGLKGPNLYLLSNKNFSPSSDSIFIIEVTDTMRGNPQLGVTLSKTNVNYGVPPQARQPGGRLFDTNDGRILGAFLENDKIHFVGNTIVPSTGYAGVYHGQVTNLTGAKTTSGYIIGDDELDYGYPNISYTGILPGDDQFMLTFEHVSPDTFGGTSAMYFYEGDYSQRLTVKNGETYINIQGGSDQRWGDYTGSQRKYNEPGVVWIASNWTDYKNLGIPDRRNATIIAELTLPDNVGIEPEKEIKREPVVFPNPVHNWWAFQFENPETQILTFELINIEGRIVRNLLTERVKQGLNKFSFSADALSAGLYILKVRNQDGIVASASVVVN